MRKQDLSTDSGELVSLSVRVTKETADALKAVADRNYRPVAAHLRFLIEADVASDHDNLKRVA
jgi:predicted DNA-binding protein